MSTDLDTTYCHTSHIATDERRSCERCGYNLADYAPHETKCGACVSEDERTDLAERLLHEAMVADCIRESDEGDDGRHPLPDGADVSHRYIYVSTDNEGGWGAHSGDSMGAMYANARTDVYQESRYAWWPMYVLDLDEQTHHKIEVVARITIGGVEG